MTRLKIIPEHNILHKSNIFNNLIEYIDERYPDNIFYHKNNKVYFELNKKNNLLYCHYELVWVIFSNNNMLEYNYAQKLIKDMVVNNANWGSVTPIIHSMSQLRRWLTMPIGGQ